MIRIKMRHVALALLLIFVSNAYADGKRVAMVAKLEQAVVLITTWQSGIEIGLGSGFFVSNDGLIVTNKHILRRGLNPLYNMTVKTRDGKVFGDFQLLNCEGKVDLCTLKVDHKPKVFFPVKAVPIRKGTEILVLGHPQGYEYTLSTGVISGVHQEKTEDGVSIAPDGKVTEKSISTEYVQVTAPISPGNSGGPIFDGIGRLIGVSTWVRTDKGSQNLNFALSSKEVEEFLKLPTKPIRFTDYKIMKSKELMAAYEKQAKKYIDPLLTALDENKPLPNTTVLNEGRLLVGDREYNFKVPGTFGKDDCKVGETPTGRRLYCNSKAEGVELMVEVFRDKVDAVKTNLPKEKRNPEPLAIVEDFVKIGKWTELEKKISAEQKKLLFSSPSQWKCTTLKIANAIPADYCSASTFNFRLAGAYSYETMSQEPADPYVVYVGVRVSMFEAAPLYGAFPILIQRTVSVKKNAQPATVPVQVADAKEEKIPNREISSVGTVTADKIFGRGLEKKVITLSGFVKDLPRLVTSKDGKTESYRFKFGNSDTDGNDHVLVVFYVKRYGQQVGSFGYKQGDKIDLIGKYWQPKEKSKFGSVGSLYVNELTAKDVKNIATHDGQPE